MAKNGKTYEDLMQLAKDYSVSDNVIVRELAERYSQQKKILDKMRADLNKTGMTVEKEYVKGRVNLCSNPLLAEWPKNNDSAARTLDALGDAIVKFGHAPERKTGKLAAIRGDG